MATNEPIAIIGTGCRFPGNSSSPSRLWDLLKEPRNLRQKISSERFSAEGFHNHDGTYHGNSNVLHSYMLNENLRQFDAQFFGIKPLETNATDPQQRVLLETVFEAIESSGMKLAALQGSDTAVFVGVMCDDYEHMLLRDTDSMPTYHATGIARSILANRISYCFDWAGPSMTIDTACSSSLVALHLAVQVLRSGESRVAVAAGTNLILGPENYIGESKLKMLSPTGLSRMWDEKADGYARGEGVAAIVLKRLSTAIEDCDHIECIVRETGTNQDGRTNGITMPSAAAQARLISQVYAKAGLDPQKETDRCQFFECHGTGTPAGDPQEAEAIYRAFFGAESLGAERASSADKPHQTPLYVGSIKTIIGHTEGTAGLAGVIKSSLALQHGTVPPNMHFDKLNPQIEPFYGNLQIPTQAIPWPAVPRGEPRRASINSFGFGGSNAHAILESYSPDGKNASPASIHQRTQVTPFVFSASSQRSLKAMLASFARYLSERQDVSLPDLAWNLYARRSCFAVRASITAADCASLTAKLNSAASALNDVGFYGSKQPLSSAPRLLGVFTGQGAQWPAMGRALLLTSDCALQRLQQLDAMLHALPECDRPAWSLVEALVTGEDVSAAAMSQPLCTSVQILLVDILAAAGLHFYAVVGHSSGEIAAAYAAGYISAEDACRIAYYRGLHASAASGAGKMMAVATSLADAADLCQLPFFKGRICVAANNGPHSVTISGDSDAVLEAQIVFDDEEKTAKLLFVDKAYHSHHMLPAAKAYKASLASFKPQFQIHRKSNRTKWFSSVYDEEVGCVTEKLDENYWNANMVQSVLFSDALATAWKDCGPFAAAIEVGPHPALRRPALSTIQASSSGKNIPYVGVLQRGQNDVDAVAACLGSLWAVLGDGVVDFDSYEKFMNGNCRRHILKGLPPYAWDKEREYWHEPRISRAFRTRPSPTHVLLGNMLPDGTHGEQYRWRNYLSVKEIPWLEGHKLQGQTVFPAAGYISMAIESSPVLLGGRTAALIQLNDLVIESALVFQEDDVAVETLFSLTNLRETDGDVTANFNIYATAGNGAERLLPKASGVLQITLGEPSLDTLLPWQEPESMMIAVGKDQFYDAMADIGYGYTGPFRALDNLSRKAGASSGILNVEDGGDRPLMIHPAPLDTAIQSVILAFCYPRDGRLWGIHVPTRIRSVSVNPALCSLHFSKEGRLPFESFLRSGDGVVGVLGDVDVYTPAEEHCILQMEGVQCIPLSQATAGDDIQFFSTTVWAPAVPDCETIGFDGRATQAEYDLAEAVERTCLYYFNFWERQIADDHPARTEGSLKGLFRYSAHVRDLVASGKHKHAKKEWMDDDETFLASLRDSYSDCLDLRVVHVVGQNIPAVVRGETTMLEHLFKDNLLTDYYAHGLGLPTYTKYLACAVGQLVHRYPNLNILEVGAGTGHATKRIFAQIGSTFESYTFTDISPSFFDKAQDIFSQHTNKIVFKVLDIEKDAAQQGFEAHSFDLIIASFVLHATANLRTTLRNLRRLLKPGGFLLLNEMTNNDPIRPGFIFGTLPGWWAGEAEGRILSPCVDPVAWDTLLRQTGFSGVDSVTDNVDHFPYPASLIVSQALDDRIRLLREPLDDVPSLQLEAIGEELLIIGGKSLKTSRIIQKVKATVRDFYTKVMCLSSFGEMRPEDVTVVTSILNLSDLDEAIFSKLDEQSFSSMKAVFQTAKCIVWLTEDCRDNNPYANMSVGFGRSMLWENPGLPLQFVDYSGSATYSAYEIASQLMQFELATAWQARGKMNDILWSIEPEVSRSVNGTLIPRLKTDATRNMRYNSTRRKIVEDVYPSECAVVAVYNGDGIHLEKGARIVDLRSAATFQNVLVQTRYSTAYRVPLNKQICLFVLLGTNEVTGEQVLALSNVLASSVVVPLALVVPPAPTLGSDGIQMLSSAVNRMIASHLLSELSEGDAIVVHEPTPGLAAALTQLAASRRIALRLTSLIDHKGLPNWVQVHPHEKRRSILQKLPRATRKLVNLSTTAAARNAARLIRTSLPGPFTCETAEDVFASASHQHHAPVYELVAKQLASVIANWPCSGPGETASANETVLPVGAVENLPWKKCFTAIIDWNLADVVSQSIPAMINRVDSCPLFGPDRSYWLIGLTGDLGLSLCEWMIKLGARYVVLSSRNPEIDGRWLAKVRSMGARVMVISCDVTNAHNLRACLDQISQEFPPVRGIAQGAMVLRDTPLRNLDLETMNTVLNPKVQGSLNIEEIFKEQDLDFFIYFSSMAAVAGNLGQSNYTAANLFMAALAAQRRKRGLAASTIHIGVILGIGYVTRETTQASQEHLHKSGHIRMSEDDFHQLFAEAVIAGRKDSGLDPEISVSLQHVRSNDKNKPVWFDNPRFSHYVRPISDEGPGDFRTGNSVPLKVQLQGATTQDQIFKIVQVAFIAKLRDLLKADIEEGLTEAALLAIKTVDIGLDSLVAFEVRSWFLKGLHVNVPVLKLLGGVSIREIIDHAISQMRKDLTPLLGAKDEPGAPVEEAALQKVETHTGLINDPEQPPFLSPGSSAPSVRGAEGIKGNIHSISPVPGTESKIDEPKEGQQSATSLERLATPPIPSVIEREGPLSPAQSMFWFVNVFVQDPTTLNHTGLLHVHGRLRRVDLSRAVDAVGAQHESLRTCFYRDRATDEPVQGVMASARLKLETHDISDKVEVDHLADALRSHVYDIEHGETMRIILLTRSATEHYLLIGCHHINIDGMSFQILIRDLQTVYNGNPLPKPLQYLDFTVRLREEFSNGMWQSDIAYWKSEFQDIPSPLPIPPVSEDQMRHPITKYDVHRIRTRLSRDLTHQIGQTSRSLQSTPFHFYLAAFRTFLVRLMDVEDLCIGIGDANRTTSDRLSCIGPYVNLLPLRFTVSGDGTQPFAEVLQDTRKKTLEALAHSRVPFGTLLDELAITRSQYHSPLFQSFVDYREESRNHTIPFGEAELEILDFETGRTAYDICLDILDDPDGCIIDFMVQSSLYPRDSLQSLAEGYRLLLQSLADDPSQPLREPSIFKLEDVQAALELGRGPVYESQWPETLIHRVEEIAKERSGDVALKDGYGICLVYREMLDRVWSIAAHLELSGVKQGAVLGIFQERTTNWVCSLLAAMHAGATYLPLDASQPDAKLAQIVQNCQPTAILFDTHTKHRVPKLTASKSWLVEIETVADHCTTPPSIKAKAEDAGVIFHTSGSTGTPKGIPIRHSSLRNEIEGSGPTYLIGVERVLQQSAPSFDMSLTQIFSALAYGGSVFVCPSSMHSDPVALTQLMAAEKITMTGGTPSECLSWIDHGFAALQGAPWRLAISGGEKMTSNLCRSFASLKKPGLRLFNAYGPTEVTCSSNREEVAYTQCVDEQMPVGPPAPNTRVYVVDHLLHLLPLGYVGEIVVAGAGIAMGYLNNEDDTKSRFVPNPFAAAEDLDRGWNILHRTGDRGRVLLDGRLVIHGRISGDTQVKLRGIRMDLRHIEQAMLKAASGDIVEAAVSVRQPADGGPEFLAAHLVWASQVAPERRDAVALLASLPLPQQMRPSVYVEVDKLPKGGAGKVDRRILAAAPLGNVEYSRLIQERTDSEQLSADESLLKHAWAEVIPTEVFARHNIRRGTDFFHVGGSSLLLVRLQRAIQEEFGVFLDLVLMFESSTLDRMAALIRHKDASGMLNGAVDWHMEAELPDDLFVSAEYNSTPTLTKKVPEVVILTGATGFLGKALLQQLIAHPSIQTVHCIAVRNPSAVLFSSSPKVHVHPGDLADATLGLDPDTANHLARTADAIIHNGANVSHLKHYHTLRAENVGSTVQLIRLVALPRRVPIHYVSTAGVALCSGRETFSEESVAASPPDPGAGTDGYNVSKWVSECVLENAARRFGLPVTIHRPSNIRRDGEMPELDLFQNLLHFSRLARAVPLTDKLSGYLNLVPVQECARGVVESVFAKFDGSRGSVRYQHRSGETNVRLDDLSSYIAQQNDGESESAKDVEILSLPEWTVRAEALGMHSTVASFFRKVDEGDRVSYPQLVSTVG